MKSLNKINNEIIDENFDTESDKDSVLALNVFYNTGSYTKITEKQAMEPQSLFPSVGGTLGLFLGISILSFVEIIEVAIEIIAWCISKCMPKRNRHFDIKNLKNSN